MSSEKRNAEFRLFRLVKDLDRSQFKVVKEYLSSFNSSKSNFWKLYQLLLKSSSFEEFQKAVATKKPLKNSIQYLSEKIIEALALENTAEASAIAFIDTAIEKGMLSMAKSKTRSLVFSPSFSISPNFRKKVWERALFLRKVFGIQIAELKSSEKYTCVLNEFRVLADAEYLAELFRSSISLDIAARTKIYKRYDLSERFPMGMSLLPETDLKIHITKRNYHLLGSNTERAFSHQKAIIELGDLYESLLSEGMKIKENFRFISMLIAFEKFEDAQYHLMEQGALETGNDALEQLQIENWIKYSLLLCACSGNTELGQRVIRDFTRNSDLFSTNWKPLLYLAVIIIETYQWNLEGVILWSNRLQRIKTGTMNSFSWVPPAAKFIAYFEQGNPKNAQDQLDEIRAINELNPNSYLAFLVETFSVFQRFHHESIPSGVFLSIERELDSCLSDSEALATSNFFNIKFWISAKKAKARPKEWLQKSLSKTIFSFRAVS